MKDGSKASGEETSQKYLKDDSRIWREFRNKTSGRQEKEVKEEQEVKYLKRRQKLKGRCGESQRNFEKRGNKLALRGWEGMTLLLVPPLLYKGGEKE